MMRDSGQQLASFDVEAEQVIFGLATDDHSGLAVPYRDDGWAWHVVVRARHAPCVGAGAGYREQVARPDVGRKVLVLDDDVTAFAVLADNPGQHGRSVRASTRHGAGIVRAVESGADVVAHSAVDSHIGPGGTGVELDRLDRADLVESERAGAGDRAAGFDADPRYGDP